VERWKRKRLEYWNVWETGGGGSKRKKKGSEGAHLLNVETLLHLVKVENMSALKTPG